MTPLLLITNTLASMKKEVAIVLVVLAALMTTPIFAVVSLVDIPAQLSGDSADTQLFAGPVSTKNTYIWGYCTFWAALRREQGGKAIPNNWGDAHDWDAGARAAKYVVDHIPAVGAIMQTDAGKLGHVAFVEKVNPDGSWEVSEMNVKGWDVLSERSFKAAQAKEYNFIH